MLFSQPQARGLPVWTSNAQALTGKAGAKSAKGPEHPSDVVVLTPRAATASSPLVCCHICVAAESHRHPHFGAHQPCATHDGGMSKSQSYVASPSSAQTHARRTVAKKRTGYEAVQDGEEVEMSALEPEGQQS
jgi:hypothetical protein